jgi:3-hydroxyisobutyrate dehydrogenase-like beta-hydroxyacid dehydrogenase
MNQNWSPQPDERKKMKVGFIGLGIMGSRMAANLQKQGNSLVVFNRTRAKAEPLLGPCGKFAACNLG